MPFPGASIWTTSTMGFSDTARRPQSTSSKSLFDAQGRLGTMGLPTQRAPPGTAGPQMAHGVSAMETTLYKEVEAAPS
eukprot:1061121-Pyramimonas_sp.AAC.1